MANQVHLPTIPSLLGAGQPLINWQRLWCPLGDSIRLESSFFFHQPQRLGFLIEPHATINSNCVPLSARICGASGVWALCGTPGSGKSAAVVQWVSELGELEPQTRIVAYSAAGLGYNGDFENLLSKPSFIQAMNSEEKVILLVDGFDQFHRENGPLFEAFAQALKERADLARLRVVVSCRSRDWNPLGGASLQGLWRGQANQVLDICPLTRGQVLLAAQEIDGVNPDAFVAEVENRGLIAATHWPLTLRSLLEEFQANGRLVQSAADRFGATINQLLDHETLPQKRLSPIKLAQHRQAAARLAAMNIFVGKQGLTYGSPRPGENLLTPQEFFQDSGLSAEAVNGARFDLTQDHLRHILGSALMTAIRPPSEQDPQPTMGFVHANYAEFLGAEYVKGLSVMTLKGLFCVPTPEGERITPRLIETASWLALMHPAWFDYLLNTMPEVLIRADGTHYSDGDRERIVVALLRHSEYRGAGLEREAWLLNVDFSFPNLANCLRPYIPDSDKPELSRWLAIEIAQQCQVAEVEDALWAVVQDFATDSPQERAMGAIGAIYRTHKPDLPKIELLHRLVREEMGHDPSDNLKGLAICILLENRYASVADIAPYLRFGKRLNLRAEYRHAFTEVVPECMSLADLPALLDFVDPTREESENSYPTQRDSDPMLCRIVTLIASQETVCEEIKRGMGKLIQTLSQAYRSLPVVTISEGDAEPDGNIGARELVAVPLETARRWFSWAVESDPLACMKHGWSLFTALGMKPNLGWVLSKLQEAPPELRPVWADIASHIMWESERKAHLPELLRAHDASPELRAALGPCEEGMDIHQSYLHRSRLSEAEQEMQRAERLERRRSRRAPPPPTRAEFLDTLLSRWKLGDHHSWLQMWMCLNWKLDGNDWHQQGLRQFVPDTEGWQQASTEQQTAMRACAKGFLLNSDDPCFGKSDWHSTNGSQAAAQAINLLVLTDACDAQVQEAIQSKWLRAWFSEAYNCDGNEKLIRIAVFLYELDREEFSRLSRESFLRENAPNANLAKIKLLERVWSPEISTDFVSWLLEVHLESHIAAQAAEFLCRVDPSSGLPLIRKWLAFCESGQGRQHPTDAYVYCGLFFGDSELFDMAIELLRRMAEQERRRVFHHLSHGLPKEENPLERSIAQIGDLVVIIANTFPLHALHDSEAEDAERKSDMERFAKRMPYGVSNTYNRLVGSFTKLAQPSEVAALEARLPTERRFDLPFARQHSIQNLSEVSWRPLRPAALVKLVHTPNACLIHSNDALQAFLVERLSQFMAEPRLPKLKSFWNEQRGKTPWPKREEDFSAALLQWLVDSRGLVVNCEVQPVELNQRRLDILVQVPASAERPALSVVIEVKKAENPEVNTSLQTQLVDTYLLKGGRTHGVYVVGLFGHGKAHLPGKNMTEMVQALTAFTRGLGMPANLRIRTLLMDCRHPGLAQGKAKPKPPT